MFSVSHWTSASLECIHEAIGSFARAIEDTEVLQVLSLETFRCPPHCPLGHLNFHIKRYGRVQLITTGFADISKLRRN